MNTPFRLWRRAAGHQATAVLLPGTNAAAVLGACVTQGLEPAGRIFAVADGLLLKLDRPTAAPIPGAIRLRALNANLLVPVDAELVPALLDDEAAGMVRDRGLVFLPGGRTLAFDPRAPLDPAALLTADMRPTRRWHPLPEPPALADRIAAIQVALPGEGPSPHVSDGDAPPTLADEAADAVLEPGGEGIGTELPRPASSGMGQTLIARAALGIGRGLMKLGHWSGFKALGELGPKWTRRAQEVAPRPSESVLGRQAAALEALLREFRDGDPERALRRALPVGEPGGPRGAVADTGDRLPYRDTTYSLGSLLGGSDRGPAPVWYGGHDIMAELMREYRQAAERALRRGDFRRAAFIHAKLLNDYRTAANILARGGLHRDAAVIYLAKLHDVSAAARAFEAAGEIDRAVRLYRQSGEHEAAGDLLRLIGEVEAAVAEYTLAADQLALQPGGHLLAGNLLLRKTGRNDLARSHFFLGWARRPEANDVPCALSMARMHAESADREALRSLLDEADAYFAPPGRDAAASQFYNEIAQLAESATAAELGDELRDRALMGLAVKLRQQAQAATRATSIVPRLFDRSPHWSAALVRDAEFAVRSAIQSPARRPVSAPLTDGIVCDGTGLVSAACASPRGEMVFLGFEGGEVFAFQSDTSRVTAVASYDLPVMSLAAGAHWLCCGRLALARRSSPATKIMVGRFEPYWARRSRPSSLPGSPPFCRGPWSAWACGMAASCTSLPPGV